MQPTDISNLHNYIFSSNPSPYPPHFAISSIFNLNGQCLNSFYGFHTSPQGISLSNSNNSTSDEADEQQVKIINERKQRRMLSNRESARRSRLRKQRHLDDLWSQVVWLRNENHQLLDKLNHVSECHDKVLQENAQLKEETVELRQMVCEMQMMNIKSPLSSLRDDLDHNITCNTAYLRAESPYHQSIAGSTDLLG